MTIFIGMIILFALGTPIGFSMLIAVLGFLFIEGRLSDLLSVATAQAFSLNKFILLAIPFFMLAAEIMNQSKITDKIFRFAYVLVSRIPGTLGHVNVVASMLFAGMSGSGIADASGLGRLEIKAMRDAGYDAPFAAAVTASSACIGPVIPPSISMVIAGVVCSVSVGKLLLGGFIPGCLMGIALMLSVAFRAKMRNYPKGETHPKFGEVISSFKDAFLALLTPVILVMGIFSGVFTPTEAAIAASAYALFIAIFAYRSIDLKGLFSLFCLVGVRCATVMFVFSCASVIGKIVTRAQLPQLVAEHLMSITQNPVGVLFICLGLFLVLGTLMDDTALLVILGPILMPIVTALGINPIHFGVLMVMSLQIAMMTPPVGITMFIACYYAEIDVLTFSKEVWPQFLILVCSAILILLFPKLTLFLPSLLGKGF